MKKYNFLSFLLGSELQNRFMLFFVMFAATPLLILGGVAIFLIGISHQYDVSNLENQLLDQKIEEVERFFDDAFGVIDIQLGVTQAEEIESGNQPWQELLVGGMLQSNSAFEEVSFIDPQGKERAKRSRLTAAPELANVSNLPYFREAISDKKYRGAVYQTHSGPIIYIAVPIRVADVVIQVVAARLNLSQLVRSIELGRLGTFGYLFLLDEEGMLVAPRLRNGISAGANLYDVLHTRSLPAGRGGISETRRYTSIFGNVPVIGSGKSSARYGWNMIAEWPISDADAIIADVREQVVRITVVAVLSMLLLAPFFARRLLQPIRLLENTTTRIEEGDFDARVSINTKDELEDLGNSFNSMAQGLKRLQELKNEFVFIASHELRTPVTAIRGYISMVLEGDAGQLSEKLKEYLTPVAQASERLVELINNILEIARSEAGRMKIEVAAMNPEEAIAQIVVETEPLAREKKISLMHSEEKLPAIIADPMRLKEILANLISNAIKYNHEGGWIKISHEVTDTTVVTHVTDNGLGMSAEEQQHLFEKFFRSSEVRAIQGTGLGLFITKTLIQKMGGEVWFASEKGKGTTFSFSLPKA